MHVYIYIYMHIIYAYVNIQLHIHTRVTPRRTGNNHGHTLHPEFLVSQVVTASGDFPNSSV